jgi:hypothetical protein
MGFDAQLASPAFFANPYPLFHQLRERAPVYWSEALGAWVLTRYADVAAVLHQPAQFRNAGRVSYLLEQLPAETRAQVAGLEAHYRVGLGHSDPPAHTRLRALLSRAFTPRLIESRRARIEQVVAELLDAARARGSFDVVRDLAHPLPATIVAEMIGAPPEDCEQFRRWALDINALFAGGGRATAESALQAQRTQIEMRDYILALAEARRSDPRDDLLSALVAAKGDRLSEAELVSTCVTLFVAGHETTTHLIGNGMLALLRYPAQLQKLRHNPALMASAVEEMLRYDAPVQRAWRLAVESVVFGGVTIPAGAMVLAMIGAANRDPAQFAEPDCFDITRADNKHFGFGHGIHFCLGAPLARLEAALAFAALLARFPTLRLASDELEWTHDIALRGLRALPVEI